MSVDMDVQHVPNDVKKYPREKTRPGLWHCNTPGRWSSLSSGVIDSHPVSLLLLLKFPALLKGILLL